MEDAPDVGSNAFSSFAAPSTLRTTNTESHTFTFTRTVALTQAHTITTQTFTWEYEVTNPQLRLCLTL